MKKREKSILITDTFDAILLIIVKEAEQPVFIKHYSYLEKKAAMHIVTEAKINQWLLLGSNRKLVEWIYSGRIILTAMIFYIILNGIARVSFPWTEN